MFSVAVVYLCLVLGVRFYCCQQTFAVAAKKVVVFEKLLLHANGSFQQPYFCAQSPNFGTLSVTHSIIVIVRYLYGATSLAQSKALHTSRKNSYM